MVTSDDKREAVDRVRTNETTVFQEAVRFGVTPPTVERWITDFAVEGYGRALTDVIRDRDAARDDVERLRKLLGRACLLLDHAAQQDIDPDELQDAAFAFFMCVNAEDADPTPRGPDA